MNIDAIIAKIKKAIRLARGTTEAGERDSALRLARNLAEKNGLAFDNIESEVNIDPAKIVQDPAQKAMRGCEVGFAVSIIREHFGVVMMRNEWPSGGCSYTWFGTKINIDIARHVFHILIRESRKEWANARKRWANKANGIWTTSADIKMSFMRGFFFAIWQHLDSFPLRNDRDQYIAEKQAAENKFLEFKAANKVEERKMRNSNASIDADAIMAGVEAGNKVSLVRPCAHNGQGADLLVSTIKEG